MLDDLMSSPLLAAALAILVVFLVMWLRQEQSTPMKKHPTIPGLAPSDPVLGNLGDIPKAGSLHEFLRALHKENGPIVSFWWGELLTVSIASPDLFKQQAKVFDRPIELFKLFEPLMTKHSIQYANGEDGRQRHTTCTRCYSHASMENYYPIFDELAEKTLNIWLAAPEEPKSLRKDMFALAIKAITRCSYGELFDDDKEVHGVTHNYDIGMGECEKMLHGETVDMGPQSEFQQAKDNLFRVIEKAMKQRQLHRGSEDLLIDVLMEMDVSDEIKKADALTFLIAGFHTSGLLFTWSIYYLAKHPDVQEKVYAELKHVLGDGQVTNDNINDLVYMKQVLDETLRCSILAPYAARIQDQETILDGHVLAPKTPVIQALGVMLENETLWPDHERFDPDRFSPEKREKMVNYSFEPFGFAGKRKCPGWRFSLVEVTAVLAILLRQIKVKLVPGQTVTKVHGLVTLPANEIMVTIEKRF